MAWKSEFGCCFPCEGGIYLTQVACRKCRKQGRTTRARMRRCWSGFRRERLPRLPPVAALARRVPLSTVRGQDWLAVERRPLGVCRLRASGVGDGRDDLSSHSDAAADVVRGGLADDEPEARRLSAGRPAVAGAGLLPNGVGDPAPLPHADGAPSPRETDRLGRGRRDVRRRC